MALETKSQLLELAREVQQLTEQLVQTLSDTGIKEPDFSAQSTNVPFTAEYNALRNRLNDVTGDLTKLVNGPQNQLRDVFTTLHELAAFQVAFDFDFFTECSENSTTDVDTLAQKTGLEADLIRRVMRLMCLHHVFEEVSDGRFAHTHASITLAKSEGLRAVGAYQLDEFFQAASHTALSLRASMAQSSGPRKYSPFEHAHGASLFEFYAARPKQAARFAKAMIGASELHRDFEALQNAYPWDSLGSNIVVDVGGGNGHISIALARSVHNARFIVQDSNADMLKQGETGSLQDLNGRVTFMRHDFFTPQPVSDGVGAYLLRQITHNWADEDCVEIFKRFVPALEKCRPGTPLLISELIIPEPGTSSGSEERLGRQMDMMMLVALGARQRSRPQFESLLAKADPRLKIVKVLGGIPIGMLEVHLMRG